MSDERLGDDPPGNPHADGQHADALGLSTESYQQLKQIARQRLASYRSGMTLGCTDLVHEAYLKLSNSQNKLEDGIDGDHALAVASMAMRQILVDHARRKRAEKRGGGAVHVTLQETQIGKEEQIIDLIDLDDAIKRLARRDPLLEKLVVLRFFAGLSMNQSAKVLGRSLRTTERDWTRARLHLYQELQLGGG